MNSSEVKVAVIIATVFIALFVAIAGGVSYANYLDTKEVTACISSGKIFAEGACVNNINDLRYVDND
jgi:hypothetical protein